MRIHALLAVMAVIMVAGCGGGDRVVRLEERVAKLEERLEELEAEGLQGQMMQGAADADDEYEAAKCKVNQRTLEAAVALYMANNDGVLPVTLDDLVVAELIDSVRTCPIDGSAYEYDRMNGQVTCEHASHRRQ